jgi:hypothetical protein
VVSRCDRRRRGERPSPSAPRAPRAAGCTMCRGVRAVRVTANTGTFRLLRPAHKGGSKNGAPRVPHSTAPCQGAGASCAGHRASAGVSVPRVAQRKTRVPTARRTVVVEADTASGAGLSMMLLGLGMAAQSSRERAARDGLSRAAATRVAPDVTIGCELVVRGAANKLPSRSHGNAQHGALARQRLGLDHHVRVVLHTGTRLVRRSTGACRSTAERHRSPSPRAAH